MKRRLVLVAVLLLSIAALAWARSDGCLRRGARGEIIVLLQSWMVQAGYLDEQAVTGVFDNRTYDEVIQLQQHNGLAVDGIVGPKTWTVLARLALYKGNAPLASRGMPSPLLSWETVNESWLPGSVGLLTDLSTRTSIQVVRIGGDWHADVEPLTAKDTKTLKSWYNGTWSWSRRPVIFSSGRLKGAASINGMPHGIDRITNGFPGHFCLHFLGSRVHETGLMDPDHQQMVMTAATVLAGRVQL